MIGGKITCKNANNISATRQKKNPPVMFYAWQGSRFVGDYSVFRLKEGKFIFDLLAFQNIQH